MNYMRIAFLILLCVIAVATGVAWKASYGQEWFILHDNAWEDSATPLKDGSQQSQFFTVASNWQKVESGLHHRYAAAGSGQGAIFLGLTHRLFNTTKSNWYQVVPELKEGWNVVSTDGSMNGMRWIRSPMGGIFGFSASMTLPHDGTLAAINSSQDWVTQFLKGCYGIFTGMGGDRYNFSIVCPYWAIEAVIVIALGRHLFKRSRSRRGFPVVQPALE